MKINIRFLSIFLLFIVTSKCGKLTEDENLIRLSNCGMEMPEHGTANNSTGKFSLPPFQWISLLTNSQSWINVFGLGSFISPRHVLTSLVSNGNSWRNKTENSEFLFIEIPVDDRIIQIANNLGQFEKFRIETIWVIILKGLNLPQGPGVFAILELKQNVSQVQYPCLVERSTDLSNINEVHVYDNKQKYGRDIDFRFMKVQSYSDGHRWITVEKYNAIGGGNPMIIRDNGKVTFLGIGGNSLFQPCDSACNDTHFLNLQFLTEGICHLTGVCELLPIATTPTSTNPTSSSSSSFSTLTPEEEIRYWDEYEDNYETDISYERRSGNGAWNFLRMTLLVFSFWWEFWILV